MIRRSLALSLVLALLCAASVSAIVVTRVTVATTATLIYTAASGGSRVLIRNAGTASVYLGTATVATTTGFELVAGDAVSLPLGPNDTVYGIVASGTVVVHAVESRQ